MPYLVLFHISRYLGPIPDPTTLWGQGMDEYPLPGVVMTPYPFNGNVPGGLRQ